MLQPKDILKLSWDQLKQMPEFGEAVQSILEPKPWKHVFTTYDHDDYCINCENKGYDPDLSEDCPVPPPITDSPEVVAERLLDALGGVAGPNLPTAVCCAIEQMTGLEADCECFAWWLLATASERSIVCLLALGKIGE